MKITIHSSLLLGVFVKSQDFFILINFMEEEKTKRDYLKTLLFTNPLFWLFLVGLIGFGFNSSTFAAPFNLNQVTGVWTNVDSDAPSTVEGIGTNEIRWGTPQGSQKAGLRFDGSSPPVQSIDIGDSFTVGSLTHFNFVTTAGTATNSATLGISLDISNGTSVAAGPLNFVFDIQETLNSSPCPSFQQSSTPCDDRITVPNVFPTETFLLEGQPFTLELLGFSDGTDLFPSLITTENLSTAGDIIGRISPPPSIPPTSQPVPEPSTLLLLGSGLAGLGVWRLKKNTKK